MPQPPRERFSSIANALSLVDTFSRETTASVWPHVSRAALAQGLRERIQTPNAIDQQGSPLCGAAATMRALVWDDPGAYAQAAIDLYYHGRADVYSLTIAPGEKLRNTAMGMRLQEADWITLCSLRDSENSVFSMGGIFGSTAAGITLPGTIESWFTALGYNKIKSETYLSTLSKPIPTAVAMQARKASELFDESWWVMLFINGQMLYSSSQNSGSMIPNHWVVETDRISLDAARRAAPVNTRVYSWGAEQTIPEVTTTTLTRNDFLGNFYGYVAAKWEQS